MVASLSKLFVYWDIRQINSDPDLQQWHFLKDMTAVFPKCSTFLPIAAFFQAHKSCTA